MGAIIQQIQTSLLNLLGQAIETMPSIALTFTGAAGSSIACTIAFPALRPGDIRGLLGLSSVGVSFAFQDIFKNFLAGILMLLHEPFQLGDQILIEGFEGTVEEISMRSTQIMTDRGERVKSRI